MNDPVAYWNRGVEAVPVMTGAAALLDAEDIADRARELGMPFPWGQVLDVGCGTGRIARWCDQYVGVDIAPDAVAYCRQQGLEASVIHGPADLPPARVDLIACLSVFTHISPDERRAYLERFHDLTTQVLVDILPGDDGGDVVAWRTRPETFATLLTETGWTIQAETAHTSAHGFTHRYYWVTA